MIANKLRGLKMIVFDFDGVFTDNKVYISDEGIESVRCDRSDGMGIEMLRRSTEIDMVVMSKEKNVVVQKRCDKLKLECYHAVDDKPSALKKLIASKSINLEKVAFVGNDLNDVECMQIVGFAACPKDAYSCATEVADLVLSRNGGDGAVRELCDLILNEKL
jgi:N-acylneuraminate cytidylyltransferase